VAGLETYHGCTFRRLIDDVESSVTVPDTALISNPAPGLMRGR
jgi:hypothetical protein